jgi:hypothetical protein
MGHQAGGLEPTLPSRCPTVKPTACLSCGSRPWEDVSESLVISGSAACLRPEDIGQQLGLFCYQLGLFCPQLSWGYLNIRKIA